MGNEHPKAQLASSQCSRCGLPRYSRRPVRSEIHDHGPPDCGPPHLETHGARNSGPHKYQLEHSQFCRRKCHHEEERPILKQQPADFEEYVSSFGSHCHHQDRYPFLNHPVDHQGSVCFGFQCDHQNSIDHQGDVSSCESHCYQQEKCLRLEQSTDHQGDIPPIESHSQHHLRIRDPPLHPADKDIDNKNETVINISDCTENMSFWWTGIFSF